MLLGWLVLRLTFFDVGSCSFFDAAMYARVRKKSSSYETRPEAHSKIDCMWEASTAEIMFCSSLATHIERR